MEPITAVGAGLAIIGSKDILLKILGPTADYVGGEIQGLVEKCNINLDNIFLIAKSKLGDRLDGDGIVSPRILKHILDEGRFCEDTVTAEYLGGILAASKNNNKNDDRGITFLKKLESMSAFQIRLHYVIYFSIHKMFMGKPMNIGLAEDCNNMEIFIPYESLIKSMDLEESFESWNILTHSIVGLFNHDLLRDYKYGQIEHLRKHYSLVKEQGFMAVPTLYGAELFLWSFGYHGYSGHELLNVDVDFNLDSVNVDNASIKVKG